MASHHEWWQYDSGNQYLDREELSSEPISMKIHVPGVGRSRSLLDRVRSACRSLGLDCSVSGDVVSVSGYPSSDDMDEDYVLESRVGQSVPPSGTVTADLLRQAGGRRDWRCYCGGESW